MYHKLEKPKKYLKDIYSIINSYDMKFNIDEYYHKLFYNNHFKNKMLFKINNEINPINFKNLSLINLTFVELVSNLAMDLFDIDEMFYQYVLKTNNTYSDIYNKNNE